jgi:hypothetical protein
MITPARERIRKSRERRRKGLRAVQFDLSEQEIDYLNYLGYGARRDDPMSLAAAVSAYLSDQMYADWGFAEAF